MNRPAEVTLLKLGGSLLTEKTEVDAVRPAVLARLAAEIAESAAADGTPMAAGGPGAAGPRHVPVVRIGMSEPTIVGAPRVVETSPAQAIAR